MDVVDRFCSYISFDTQSDENSTSCPSAEKEKRLAEALVQELQCLGLKDARMDSYGYVYARLNATPGREDVPALGLIAHMDTSPDAPGANVHPRRIRCQGGSLPLDAAGDVILDEQTLAPYVGQELIVTDGTTLLGADDKAGIAEIVSAAAYLLEHPDIPHGPICLAFTPDEEIGRGTEHFDLAAFGAPAAYTVDGGALGELEYENFNAANAHIHFTGFNIHPGEAKNKMRNAILLAQEFLSLMPPAETPAHTEGREGFFHVNRIEGNESAADLYLLIRDHDRTNFEARKEQLSRMAAYLNGKYGPDTAVLYIRDSYYNMREKIEPEHMDLIHRAAVAMEAEGVTPRIVPIRGGTDGAQLSWKGLPCPNLCTGGVNFHSVREFIPIPALETMVRILVRIAAAQGSEEA
ncbi:MAG: peptidase T [Clostridiales bacterium]|nr:peptidase T [Clostridiales bacterium]MDY4037205.1 peptidase T [Candidatus Pseudoscilispira sp.]